MKTLEILKSELSALIDKLRATYGTAESDSILEKIRAKEAEIEEAKIIQVLARVNREQEELRNTAKQVWECEQPENDITTNDGSFHAVKVRKYPNLAALKYPRATWKNGKLWEIEIGRKRFQMFEYVDNTRPATFEDFLRLNSIMQAELSLEAFKEIEAQNAAANAEFQAAVKKLDATREKLGISALNYYGLFAQRSAGHIYEYTANI